LILLIVGVAFVATSLVFYGSTSLRGEIGRASAQVASINGEEIPPARFQRVLRNYLENYRRTDQQNVNPELPERVGLRVTVSDADAEAFLKTHAAHFSRPERRKVQYALLAPKAFAQVVSDQDAETYYKEHGAEFERPKRLKTAHILVRVPPTGGSEAENKSRAKIAEAIRRVKAGEDFGKLAKEISEDTATAGKDFAADAKQLGLEVKETTIARGDGLEGIGRDPGLEDALFGLAVGGVTPPIKTAVGIMIAKVTEQFAAGVPPFAEVKDRVVESIKRERAQAAAEERAKALGASVGAGDLLAAARRDTLPGGETPLVSRAESPKE